MERVGKNKQAYTKSEKHYESTWPDILQQNSRSSQVHINTYQDRPNLKLKEESYKVYSQSQTELNWKAIIERYLEYP